MLVWAKLYIALDPVARSPPRPLARSAPQPLMFQAGTADQLYKALHAGLG